MRLKSIDYKNFQAKNSFLHINQYVLHTIIIVSANILLVN